MTTPYSAFLYQVRLADGRTFAGFTEISGLVASRQRATLTLRRGVVDSAALIEWFRIAQLNDPSAKKSVTVTLLDEARKPVKSWQLRGVLPAKYTGPTLSAKGTDVAMEELQLTAEGIDIV